MSNALGTVLPVQRIAAAAHAAGAVVLVDGAQAVPHIPVDVRALDCDFYAFSGHKLYGPTGIGVLYGREALLAAMPPWQGGGDMILTVSFEKTTYNELPYKFEAGTPNISGAIGLAAAMDYLESAGDRARSPPTSTACSAGDRRAAAHPRDHAHRHGGRQGRRCCRSRCEGVHPHDLGTILDSRGRGDPHRAPLRDAGHGASSGCRPRRAPPSAATTTRRTSTRLVRRAAQVREVFG